jgi:hypothetical protein
MRLALSVSAGASMPSVLAVLRLITSSNLVARCLASRGPSAFDKFGRPINSLGRRDISQKNPRNVDEYQCFGIGPRPIYMELFWCCNEPTLALRHYHKRVGLTTNGWD